MRGRSLSDDQRLWVAWGLAALIHLLLLFALRLGVEPAAPQSLEVSFVTVADGSASLAARVLAPVAHAGGGYRRELRAMPPRATGLAERRGNERAVESGHRDAVTRAGTAPNLIASSAPSATAVPDSQDAQAGDGAKTLLPQEEAPGIGQRNSDRNEAALLSSELMPGRAHGISTRAHREALYRDLWRRRVEQAGAENFPWSALTLGRPQSLTLSVTVRADGSVSRVRVLRSSGQPALDKAAMEILRIAAPFPAFPEPLRASAAELNFSYDWEFLPGDHSELRVGRP